MKIRHFIIGLLLNAALATSAWAVPVISGVTGGSGPFSSFYGSAAGDVIGYGFTADVDLTVTSLGILDDPLDGVLDSAHMVGLWDLDTQNLLGSVSVDSTGSLIDGFYYSALGSAINLTAGVDYVLGAMYTADDNDGYLSGASFTTANISMTSAVFPSVGELGFVFPTEVSAGNPGRVGPNMLAEPTMTSVPEPGSLLLVGLGLVGMAVVRRRRA